MGWAAQVTPWGQTHTAVIFKLLSSLKAPNHKAKIQCLQSDLAWWAFWLRHGTNRMLIWPPTTSLDVFTDASNAAGGAFCRGDWLYTHWASDCGPLSLHHINTKELAAVVMAACRWGHLWANHRVVIHTDSTVTEAALNKGTARNSTCMDLQRQLSDLALHHGFLITAMHITTHDNVLADTISRLHTPGKLQLLSSMLLMPPHPAIFLPHMSTRLWWFLFQRALA